MQTGTLHPDDCNMGVRRVQWRTAFTLVELLIVVILIAVLAAVAIPKFSNSVVLAKEARLRAALRNVRSAVERFRADTGLYPISQFSLKYNTSTTGLDAAGNVQPLPPGSNRGPYTNLITRCPFSGNVLVYDTTPPDVGRYHSDSSLFGTNGIRYRDW